MSEGARVNTYHDTGTTVESAGSTVTAFNYDKVVKGQTVNFVITGTGLSSDMKVKVTAPSTTCSGTSDSGGAISGGTGDNLHSANADNGSPRRLR